ncbi:hypothetical protein JRQ81_001147 [Phrynocephalus forsythii]|uniref:Uncharacterized protein n=1 Tax=Phrynocephalus forsythii TaxID=171643 RepID=A0A9Q1B847_9SAUR|nr:hypothetical protein JRQ81_001147 [Phrynocephalus forsythii]
MRMADGRIPKDLLYGELVQGKCPGGRPQLRYKDSCKRDLKTLGLDLNRWETLTADSSAWRKKIQHGLLLFEGILVQQDEEKRQSRKQRHLGARQGTDCICPQCGRDCHSLIGLFSHTRCCFRTSIQRLKDVYTYSCLLQKT